MVCAATITGYSYIEPFYVLNSSNPEIVVKTFGNEYTIGPESIKKIRVIHFHGVTTSNETIEISYNNTLTDMPSNWHPYDDTYTSISSALA